MQFRDTDQKYPLTIRVSNSTDTVDKREKSKITVGYSKHLEKRDKSPKLQKFLAK